VLFAVIQCLLRLTHVGISPANIVESQSFPDAISNFAPNAEPGEVVESRLVLPQITIKPASIVEGQRFDLPVADFAGN